MATLTAAVRALPALAAREDLDALRPRADEVWRSRTGSILTLVGDGFEIRLSYDPDGRKVGASVVADRPSAALRDEVALLLDDAVAASQHPDEAVVTLPWGTLHVVTRSGEVTQVVASALREPSSAADPTAGGRPTTPAEVAALLSAAGPGRP